MLKAHLLDTLNDVIGHIEKILEAFEKKSFTSKFIFSEISSWKSHDIFIKIVKYLRFLAYIRFGASHVPNFFTSGKSYAKSTF